MKCLFARSKIVYYAFRGNFLGRKNEFVILFCEKRNPPGLGVGLDTWLFELNPFHHLGKELRYLAICRKNF